MKIRKASLKDVNNIFQLMKLNKELKNSTNCSYFDKKFLKTIITDKGIIFLVVEDNKKVLGVLGAAVWKKEKICYADFIFIDKRYRGKGVGLELHKYFIKNLKKEGIFFYKMNSTQSLITTR